MPLRDCQDAVDAAMKDKGWGYWAPEHIGLRLSEETGELAREINHRFGPKQKKSEEGTRDLEEEAGDIIYTICCLANSQGLDLSRGFQRAMDKMYGRDASRYSSSGESL